MTVAVKSKPLNIKNPEDYRLARTLADQTGQTLTETVIQALRDRLQRNCAAQPGRDLVAEMKAIADRVSALPMLDRRSEDEILGYNEHGFLE